MINAILLSLVVIGVTVQSACKKSFNQNSGGGTFTFSAASTLFAIPVFILASGGKLEPTVDLIPYSLLFALSYTAATAFSFLAIKEGSLALSSLIIQYSLIIPTLFGFILWDEKISAGAIVGIALLLISLALINYRGKAEEKNVTPKWLIYILIAFIGNGMCSTSQKAWQMKSGGLHESEFMIIALLISFFAMAIIALLTERGGIGTYLRSGVLPYAVCGIANGVVNLLVLILSESMAASLMFPIISAGGIITTYAFSKIFYKEKMSKYQTLGLFVGVVSIIVLNL